MNLLAPQPCYRGSESESLAREIEYPMNLSPLPTNKNFQHPYFIQKEKERSIKLKLAEQE